MKRWMIMDEVIKERKDGYEAECNFRTEEKNQVSIFEKCFIFRVI